MSSAGGAVPAAQRALHQRMPLARRVLAGEVEPAHGRGERRVVHLGAARPRRVRAADPGIGRPRAHAAASPGRIARSGRMSTTDAIQASGSLVDGEPLEGQRRPGERRRDRQRAAVGRELGERPEAVADAQRRARRRRPVERQEQLRRGAIADRGQRPCLGLGERRVERDQVDDRGRDRRPRPRPPRPASPPAVTRTASGP